METDLGNKTIGLKRDADLHGFNFFCVNQR
jgi:hypothetical protein